METSMNTKPVNDIDVAGLMNAIEEIAADPSKGKARFRVSTAWAGQTRSETTVEGCELGGEKISRTFRFRSDEPLELFGSNQHPNPQEYLMGALNSCMLVGYVAGAAVRGIRLQAVEIESRGELDLRGFLGIDDTVAPGYESLTYRVRIRGEGTREQFEEIHETVLKTSPNYFNLSRPILLKGELVTE